MTHWAVEHHGYAEVQTVEHRYLHPQPTYGHNHCRIFLPVTQRLTFGARVWECNSRDFHALNDLVRTIGTYQESWKRGEMVVYPCWDYLDDMITFMLECSYVGKCAVAARALYYVFGCVRGCCPAHNGVQQVMDVVLSSSRIQPIIDAIIRSGCMFVGDWCETWEGALPVRRTTVMHSPVTQEKARRMTCPCGIMFEWPTKKEVLTTKIISNKMVSISI
jgi:hypothetical protein